MSWQAYVDTNLVGTGAVSQAGIYGLNGGAWAVSPGFSVQPNEIQKIIAGFSNNNELISAGVYLNNVKYFVLSATDRSIYGKKEKNGVCIVKTGQAILIGLYDENIQPGACNKVVEQLADYLISVGY